MDFPVKYKQLWSDWGIRVLMLLSLFIQIILIFLGRLRKTSTSKWIRMLVWSSYLLADWVADFVLGQLSNAMDDSSSSNAIIAFWAPFLILHLGGPDTITAYSMEDNELWPRHLASLIYELIIAFYVLIRSLPNTRLLAPTILIFIVAIIKYVERSYSLYKASTEGFLSFIKSFYKKLPTFAISDTVGLNALSEAFKLYFFCKGFFIDVREIFYIDPSVGDQRIATIRNYLDMKTEEVSIVTSKELSFAYDEFYTKAAVNHSRAGYVLRALCSICILLAFSLYVLAPKDDFDELDVVITYVLLAASIFLDTVATIMFMFSDWMMVTLLNVKKLRNFSKLLAEQILRIKRVWLKRKHWSGEIPQLNLISNCLMNYASNKAPHRSMMDWITKKLSSMLGTKSYLSVFGYHDTFTLCTQQPIHLTEELQDIITTYAQKSLIELPVGQQVGFFFLHEVTNALNWVDPSFFNLLIELPLDQQVLVWHITTELCFHWKSGSLHPLCPHQIMNEPEDNKPRRSKMEVCKYLSNYMMYMVLMRPEMMSTMGGDSSFKLSSTWYHMVKIIDMLVSDNHLVMPNAKVEEVCRVMLITYPIKWWTFKLLIDKALMLAHLMLLIKDEERWDVLTTVWTNLLIQGANNTKAITHVKQLSRGGELLTLIWLLTKSFMSKNYVKVTDSESMKQKVGGELLSKIKDHLQNQL